MSEALFAYDRARGRYACGADEVGMACWAGPMVAAAVRFDYERLDADAFARMEHLNSSKKVSPLRRAALLPVLLEVADMVACVAIPVASIAAKELRDDLMRRLDVGHPGYGFAAHKGYGTPEHEEALVKLKPSRAHRRSYLGKVYRRLGVPPPANLEG